MTRWLVSVPAWGQRCVDVFCATALPALERAVLHLCAREGEPSDVRVVVHTDQPGRIRAGATQIAVETRPTPAGLREFDCLSQAHRDVLGMACRGDIVVLLTADLVISEQGLTYCAEALTNEAKRLVLCASPRARQEGHLPDTASAEALMRWAWENRHAITDACLWPSGLSADLSRMYFSREKGSVEARLCLPHPLAVRMDGRQLSFVPTIDANLMQNFEEGELHLATRCDELTLVELSPREKGFAVAEGTMEARYEAGEFKVTDPLQLWCAEHRVTLFGPDVDCGGAGVVRRLVEEARE